MRLLELWKIVRPHRRLVFEAFVAVVLVRVGLTLLRFQAVYRFVSKESKARVKSSSPKHIVWAVTAVSKRVPGANCLTRVLAGAWLFSRHGHEATIHYGVSMEGTLHAHAWLESGGRAMMDAPAPGTFAALA